MLRYGARVVTVTTGQANANTRLVGGPVALCGYSFTAGAAGEELQARGSAAAPAAGATIATLNLPPGTWTIEWTLELTGTPGAADVDNVSLNIGALQIATSVNLGAVGNYPQEEAQAAVAAVTTALTAKAIGAAAVGSVYTVNLLATPVGYSLATINDSGQALAFVSVGQGQTTVAFLSDEGIQVRNQLSVQTTQGVLNGVLYYRMVVPGTDPDYPSDYAAE